MKIVGNMVGSYDPLGNTFILEDQDGNQVTAVVVDQEVIFTATAADVAKGKVAATDSGIIVGTHEC